MIFPALSQLDRSEPGRESFVPSATRELDLRDVVVGPRTGLIELVCFGERREACSRPDGFFEVVRKTETCERAACLGDVRPTPQLVRDPLDLAPRVAQPVHVRLVPHGPHSCLELELGITARPCDLERSHAVTLGLLPFVLADHRRTADARQQQTRSDRIVPIPELRERVYGQPHDIVKVELLGVDRADERNDP